MKLTGKNGRLYVPSYVKKEAQIQVNNYHYVDMYNKLADLEDIEDELGLSLILLNQIRHSKQVYVKNDKNEIVVGYVDSINIRKYIFRGRYKGVPDLKNGFRINFKDYGTKIALTKEELEKNID